MAKFLCSVIGKSLIIAGLVVITVLVVMAIYYGTYNSEITENSSTTESESTDWTTIDPENTDPTTTSQTDPSISTTPEPPVKDTSRVLLASTNSGRIMLLNLNDGNYTTIVNDETENITSFDYLRKNQTIFYGTESPGSVKSSADNFTSTRDYSSKWMKTAMSIDYVTEKLYLLDGKNEKLYLMDIKNDHYAVVLTDLDKPKDMLLDIEKRLMFILQTGSILVANMDGLHVEKIVEDSIIQSFAIDRELQTIYYANANSMKSFNYANKFTSSLTDVNGNVISMTVFEDRLLYINDQGNTNRSLKSCTLSKDCKDMEEVMISNEHVSSLSQVKAYEFIDDNFINPCAEHNGHCQHLCVFSSDNYTCKCNAGWELNDDSKTCSPIENYIVYFQSDTIKGRALNVDDSFVDMDLDIDLKAVHSASKLSFDYDTHAKFLVHASGTKLHYKNLSDISSSSEWTSKHKCKVIPVIDWSAKNLYNFNNCGSGKKSYLSVRKLNESLINEKQLLQYEGSITSIVVVPDQGKMFFTQYDKSSKKTTVHFANLDGTQWQSLRDYEASETCLTVSEDGLIYYLYEKTNQVFELTKNLSVQAVFNISMLQNPKSMSIFQGKLYVANDTDLWRFERDDSKAVRMMQVTDIIQNFRVYSKQLQPIDVKQPCVENNGDCQRFCFAMPLQGSEKLGRTCGCYDDELIMSDNRRCAVKNFL